MMNVKTVYERIKENSEKPIINVIGGTFNISTTDTNGNTLLHYAAQSNDLETVKSLLKEGIIYNNKNNDGKTPSDITHMPELKDLLQNCNLFFKKVKAGNFHEVSKCIIKEKYLINMKEEGSFSPLYWATNNCHENIVRLLLENEANAVEFTDKGITPLHIAVSKKDIGIIQLLLKSCRPNMLLQFVNAQIYKSKNACLHIAAENGCFEIVKLLLKYGAIYDIANEEDNTPFHICKAENVKSFLKVIDDLFMYAKDGNSTLIGKLNQIEISEFEAITNAQNYIHHTILQELTVLGHKNIADKLILIQRNNNKLEKKQWKLEELKGLENSANLHCEFSKMYIDMLRRCSYPEIYDINLCPWKTLKEGSYYLGNAYKLVTLYKKYNHGLIEDENMLIIDATLKKFQFNPEHVSFVPTEYDESSIFASKAESQDYYYTLLNSELKTDIRHFIKIVEHNIDEPVKRFLTYIQQEKLLCISINLDLMESIKDEDYSAVSEYIRKGADVNFFNDAGESPLQQAIKKMNAKIVKLLLETGADVKKNSSLPGGNTFLHFAVTLDTIFCTEKDAPLDITKYLLQHGATYNAKNKEGKMPKDISKHTNVTTLLKIIETCFKYAEEDNVNIFFILKNMEKDEFRAATQSCSNKGYTLLQTALSSTHKKIEEEILNILKVSKSDK